MDIDMLSPETLRTWCARLDLPAAASEALQAMAAAVRAEPELEAVFAAFHLQTALRGEWHREWAPLPFDPRVQARLGERTSLFYLLAYLAALPYLEKEYRRRGIALDILDATLQDIRFYMGDYFACYGQWGYDQFAWIWRHLAGRLFRLGRMQYMLVPFPGGVTAFRRKADGGVVVLADPAQPLRADGYAGGGAEAWLPEWAEEADGWRGHRVTPYGWAQRQAVFLPRAEWAPALQQGDTVLDVHIPRLDPLTEATCRASLAWSERFFAEYFADQPYRAVFCHTWFFTPQLQKLLPSESHIVRFQREFFLYPYPGDLQYLWNFVFTRKYPDRATAPRDTALRRAVLDWLDGGGEIFDLPGVRFHGAEAWGTQPYMRAWDEKAQDELPAPAVV